MINPLTTPRILCLGEILYDYLADQKVESWTSYPGGAPANVACAATKLGSTAAFIGCVGQDQEGKELTNLLESLGVDCRGIQTHPTAPTRKVYVLRSETGDRSFADFGELETDQFADAFLYKNQLPETLWQEADFLVLGTLGLAYSNTKAAIFQALEWAKKYAVKVVLDVNWRPMFWTDPQEAPEVIKQLYPAVNFLKLSNDEAQWLFQTETARTIYDQLDNLEGIIITAGDQGVNYCINNYQGIIMPPSVKVEDTTGAGDAFLGGFIHQLCQQGLTSLNQETKIREMINYACVVGSLTTTKAGAIAAQPTEEEVKAFLQTW